MKIAIVGATGATGRRVVKLALVQGHFVTAVARHPERLSSADRLSSVRGDVLSPGGLTGALDGVEAVISCIGPEKNLSPGMLMSVGVASILTECKRADVRRFILQSGIGLSDGRELSWSNRFVVRVSSRIFTAAITDKAVAERLTQELEVEWVIVRRSYWEISRRRDAIRRVRQHELRHSFRFPLTIAPIACFVQQQMNQTGSEKL